MIERDAADTTSDDPVEVQEALVVPEDDVNEPPTDPSEQPPLPDFNT